MNKKHVAIALVVGMLAGYALNRRLDSVPVVNRIPKL